MRNADSIFVEDVSLAFLFREKGYEIRIEFFDDNFDVTFAIQLNIKVEAKMDWTTILFVSSIDNNPFSHHGPLYKLT